VIKKGKDKGSYDGAPLSLSIVPRLETALILGQDTEGEVIGVVRDATSTASAKALASYQGECSPEDFAALFEPRYRRAWRVKGEKDEVPVDAFITGTIRDPHPEDKDQVQVIIKVFDRDSYDAETKRVKPRDVVELAVPRDQDLCSDLGVARYVRPGKKLERYLSRGVHPSDRDKASDDMEEDKPAEVDGMTFKLFYKKKGDDSEGPGKEQALTLDSAEKYFVAPTPGIGDKITMALEPKDKKKGLAHRLGVVIKVNGQSLWRKEEGPSVQCKKWMFEPKKELDVATFEGFYFENKLKNFKRFEVVDSSRSKHPADKVGWIHVDFFASAEAPRYKDDPDKDQSKIDEKTEEKLQKDKDSDGILRISTRSLGSPASEDGKLSRTGAEGLSTKKLCEVQEALRKANNIKKLKPVRFKDGKAARLGNEDAAYRNVIDSSDVLEVGPEVGDADPLQEPALIGSIVIRYRQPDAKK